MTYIEMVVEPAKPVAYLSKRNGCVYIPKHKDEGGGVYYKDGEFRVCSYDHVPQDTWDKNYIPLYAGTKLVMKPVAKTKEITL